MSIVKKHILYLWVLSFAVVTYSNMSTLWAASNIHIADRNEWYYFKGTEKPPRKWNHEEFDDSRWIKGLKGTGYGKHHSAFVLDDMKGSYKRVYARRKFNVNNPQSIIKMSLSVVCDGPFVAYLNGMMVIRNVTGLATSNPAKGGNPTGEELDISGWAHELNSGQNVLSVQCDNDDINSNDFIFIPSLKILEVESAR
ncbi:MAG: hypothetical protein C4538_05465 [Nitrospiraceae bacterium]|nr:MAG: hypothetical protein C4538_05465 [Nitrospiraceae bacterium]